MAEDPNNKYSAPSGPPPGYGAQIQSPQSTGGPYYATNDHNGSMIPYNQQPHDVRAPDPAYGGHTSPPPGGYYGPPPNLNVNVYGQPGQGPPPVGYYGPPQSQPYPHPQPMYYPPRGHPAGYYQSSGGAAVGGGICAGIMGALALCCCLDFLF